MARSQSHISQRQRRTVPPPTQSSVEPVIDLVKPQFVPYFWDFVSPYVDGALAHANGEVTTEDIYAMLCGGQMYLFVIRQPKICAAITCEVVQYIRKRAVRVVTLGGSNMEAWGLQMHKRMEEFCEEVDADGMEAFCRPGMGKQLERVGYKPIYVRMWYGRRRR